MQIKISNLKLKNFKGIKNLEINFEGKNANIYGKNATGKTTVFDAFKWLFFDKDSSDRKDFNIKTLDENNKPIHFLEHEVEAILLIDGVDMTFKKMLKEKWVTKRGETQQEFSGHETSYWIDEVPVKKKDYEEKINSLVPESLFKLITDPLYFNKQLKWQERREILTNISGNQITDEEILNANEEFKTLQQNLNGRSIEDYKKVIQSKIKELNNQKESIPIRIDELTNTLVTEHNINYDELEKQKETYNQELKKIETEMFDIQARAKENIEKASELIREAAAQGAQVILPPELFERPYFCQERRYEYYGYARTLEEDDAVIHMKKLAKELETVIPVSFYEAGDHRQMFNSVAVIDADGSVRGIYRKTHIPDDHYYQEKFYFTPGDTGFRAFKTRYGTIGVGICWDQWFPETARGLALKGAELLFYPTAIGSEPILGCDSMPHWRRCMMGHAACNLMPVIAANRIGTETVEPCAENGQQSSALTFYGSSFITDATGKVTEEMDRVSEGFILHTFDLDEIEEERRSWGLFRDRRPEIYLKE